MDSSVSKTVCVTGADGYIGSWLVKMLINQGYTVRATIYPANMKNVKHLLDLPGASTKLTLWKADMTEEGSFDEAIKGCSGVFHLATPLNFESKDPENEMINPTIKGVLDIMRSCVKAKTVRRMMYTSSAGAVNLSDQKRLLFDENCWTDVEYCRRVKMTGWMYFVSKTLAEQEAWKFAKEHNIDLITTLPTIVIGSFISPTMPPSLVTALSPITGNEAHYWIIKQGQFVHLDDLCRAHIFLFEHPKAEGRYICSAFDSNIHQTAKLINDKYPEYKVPTKFKNIPDELELVRFSSKKLIDLGFQFKYTLEDMFTGAIDTCREKGLIPKSAPETPSSN